MELDDPALPRAGATAGARAPRVREEFSTTGLHRRERLERWEDHNARALVGLECRTLDESPLEAREENLRVGPLRLARVTATRHAVERTPRRIARGAADGVALYFTLAGESFFYHLDGVHLLRPGRLLVCDPDRPFMRGFTTGLRELVLVVPRERLRAVLDEPPALEVPGVVEFADPVSADPAATALARLVGETLARPERRTDGAVEAASLQLVRELLTPAAARGGAGLRRRALAVIDHRFEDGSLGVGDVAAACGVSARHLTRVFAEQGGDGVARTITERRLTAASAALVREPHRSVGDVALACGFGSHAQFTRVFRARFGVPPRALRAQARPGA